MTTRDAHTDVFEHRSAILDFERSSEGDERDIYTFPLSSEEPYRRWRGDEILVHEKHAVDLTFLNSGSAPLLHQHDAYSGQIGVITKAWLDEKAKKVYVSVRFSRRPDAQAVKMDIDDGILRNVSVGYNVLKTDPPVEGDGEDEVSYRVTRWKAMEASIVSIPADATVGIGRSTEDIRKVSIMPIDEQTRSAGGLPPASAGQSPEDAAAAVEARNAELASQIDEINALARSHNMADVAQDFISSALRAGSVPSLAVFRGVVREALPDDVPLVNNDVGLQKRETKRFSIVRLARALADSATGTEVADAAFELEACEAAARNFDGHTNGHRLPEEVMRSWSSFEVDGVSSTQHRAAMSTGLHPNVQATDHLAERFIENLRNASSVMQAGVTVLPGLSGNIEIPGADANSSAAWLAAEGDDAAETVPTFRKVELSVKDIAGHTVLTRRMLQQTTIAIEAYVRSELLTAVALGIDLGALSGSGAGGVPTGLKNTSGIGAVTFAALGAPVRAEVIEMWSDVATQNAAVGNLSFMSNALMVGHFMNEKVDAGSGRFMMDGPNSPLLMTNHIMSNQVADNDLYYGNWSDMLMGMWGGLDIDRDPHGLFLSGGIRLRAIQSVDVGVRRVSSFCLGNGGV